MRTCHDTQYTVVLPSTSHTCVKQAVVKVSSFNKENWWYFTILRCQVRPVAGVGLAFFRNMWNTLNIYANLSKIFSIVPNTSKYTNHHPVMDI